VFEESKRESLAAELAASTNGRTAMNLIAQLDDHCLQHDVGKHLSSEYWTGPFGVFEIQGRRSSSRSPERLATETTTGTADSLESITKRPRGTHHHARTAEVVAPESTTSPPLDVASNESPVEEIGDPQEDMFAVLENFDSSVMRLSPQRDFWQFEDQFMQDLSIPMDLFGGDFTGLDFFDSLPNTSTAAGAAEIFSQADVLHIVDTHPPDPKSHADWAHLLTEAPLLLRCYESANDACESAKQSFWRTFVLPSAVRTFGELSIFGRASDVISSIFYSTLANSAFAMQDSDAHLTDDSHWRKIGESAEEAAHYFLQCALRSDTTQPDGQELLSANLALCLVSVSLFRQERWIFVTDQFLAIS